MKLHLLLIAASLCALSCLSCESRDPEAEFQELSSTAFEPREGMEKAKEYLDYFKKNGKARLQEVSTLLFEYETMADFDRKTYTDYAGLISEGQELSDRLATSQSAGVRNAWYALYKDKRKQTMRSCMQALSEIDFTPDLAKAAREICSKTYYTWDVEQVSELSIGPAELIEDGIAKRCAGEYEVTLRRKLIGGVSVAKVSACGRFTFDSKGHLHFTQEDAQILEGPMTFKDLTREAEEWGLLGSYEE